MKNISRILPVLALMGGVFAQNGATLTLNGIRNVPTATGTAQAQAVTVSAVTSLTNGLVVCFIPVAANTAAAPTLAVNGLTATAITRADGTALAAGDLSAGTYPACVIYESGSFLLSDPQTVGGGSSSTAGTGIAVSGSLVSLSPSVTVTSSTVLTIGAEWSASHPFPVFVNGQIVQILTAPVTVTISGTSSMDTPYAYVDTGSSPGLVVGYGSGETLTCSTGNPILGGAVQCVSGVPSTPIPPNTYWGASIIGNVWQTTFTDLRASFNATNPVLVGSGLSSSGPVNGVQTLSTDPTITPRYFASAGNPGLRPALNCTTVVATLLWMSTIFTSIFALPRTRGNR